MTDNLRAAAQEALETLEDVFGKDKIDVGAINNLRAALVETQMPTKICGPNLVGMLNAAGFYRKKEWVGLTEQEKYVCYLKIDVWSRCVEAVEAKLREKNGG
tara:strand:+ start:84 stop:389 length:306 start_codon:yes stop_codon:yes gene_type:complete